MNYDAALGIGSGCGKLKHDAPQGIGSGCGHLKHDAPLGIGSGCGKPKHDAPLGIGFEWGPAFAAWIVSGVQTADEPSRTTIVLVWPRCRCCSVHHGLLYGSHHDVVGADSGSLRPGLAMGSGSLFFQSPAPQDALWVQVLQIFCWPTLSSSWWGSRSSSQHLQLVPISSQHVLGAAERRPAPQMDVSRWWSPQLPALWAGF